MGFGGPEAHAQSCILDSRGHGKPKISKSMWKPEVQTLGQSAVGDSCDGDRGVSEPKCTCQYLYGSQTGRTARGILGESISTSQALHLATWLGT